MIAWNSIVIYSKQDKTWLVHRTIKLNFKIIIVSACICRIQRQSIQVSRKATKGLPIQRFFFSDLERIKKLVRDIWLTGNCGSNIVQQISQDWDMSGGGTAPPPDSHPAVVLSSWWVSQGASLLVGSEGKPLTGLALGSLQLRGHQGLQ